MAFGGDDVALPAPFPWFGGKRRVGTEVWKRFGRVDGYVEPFAGSLAVLLASPPELCATVNDRDRYVANFWRAVKSDPAAVAAAADWPVNEVDLRARHDWLVTVGRERLARLDDDPDDYDAKIAGWWVWGLCSWIGSGWCPEGRTARGSLGSQGRGVNRKMPHLGNQGQGVNRKLLRLGDWMQALADRLRPVRVCTGDWSRVVTPSVLNGTAGGGTCAVFLDPPYSEEERAGDLYATDSGTVVADVRVWALANGDNPKLRIALCGYVGEHEMPGWTAHRWKAHGGYGSQGQGRGRANAAREVVWFSPSCQPQRTLFEEADPCST